MATYRYDGDLASGANDGTSWANAFQTYAAAVAAASSDGDIILSSHTGTEDLSGNTTYTYLAHIAVISVDKSSDTPTPMGTTGYVGNNSASRSITLSGAKKVYHFGMTFRTASTASAPITVASADGAHHEFEQSYLWVGTTQTGSHLLTGGSASGGNYYARFKDCTFRFGATAQQFQVGSRCDVEGGSIATAGSAPTNFVQIRAVNAHLVRFEGFDASHAGSGNLVGDFTGGAAIAVFSRCKLGASFVMLASQTVANLSSGEVFLFDCDSGDVHIRFGHANALGSTVIDTGIFFTTGDAALSWKIVTTSAANFYTPYCSPWVDWYNATLSAQTPYFEILRDGSATAYQNDEVWPEFAVKNNSGSPLSSIVSGRMALLGSPANISAGAGLGSWTGEGGTAWSGKLDGAGSVTPAEVGHLRGRICVGEPSITLYADPQIRV